MEAQEAVSTDRTLLLDKAARQVRSSQGATLVKFMVGVHSREEAPTSRAEVEVVEATSEELEEQEQVLVVRAAEGPDSSAMQLESCSLAIGLFQVMRLPRKEMGLAKGQLQTKSLEQMDGSLSNISGVPVSHVRNVRLWARPG